MSKFTIHPMKHCERCYWSKINDTI